MSINLTDEIEVKTKKGKLGAAKQIFLEGDTQTVEKEIQDINSRHNTLNTKHESLSRTVQGIAVTGGASTANNVTYNNDNSGLNAENAQDAIDELQSSIADETTRAKAAEEAIIFDVSAHNDSAVFESLSALLNSSDLNTLIPTSVRHGGMSIRFIQGSISSPNNKYVQYRLTNQSWSIDVDDWQEIGSAKFLTGEKVSEIGIDEEPTVNSENLVKSGGVYPTINSVNKSLIPINGKVSIIGDSISTFAGTMPSGYPPTYPNSTFGVTSVHDMWWHLLLSMTNSKLEVNASYSGSRVTNGVAGSPDFYDRTNILGSPDYIFVELGTNDGGVVLGDYDYDSENLSESEFIPAYIKGVKALKANYPNAKIVLFVFQMANSYASAIKNIGKHYELDVIDVRSYYKDNVHPNKLQMCSVTQTINSFYIRGKYDDEPTVGSDNLVKSGGILNLRPSIAVLGDTLSNFIGETYYPISQSIFPNSSVTVVEDMYWKKLQIALAANCINLSGGNFGVTTTVTGQSLYKRLNQDVARGLNLYILQAGYVDSVSSVTIGEEDYDTPTSKLSESTFATAYIKAIRYIKENNEKADILCVISTDIKQEYIDSIIRIANHFNIPYCRLVDSGNDDKDYHYFYYHQLYKVLSEKASNYLIKAASCFEQYEYIDAKKYLYILKDSGDKLLLAIDVEGNVVFGNGCPKQIEKLIKPLLDFLSETEDDIKERLELTLDQNGNLLSWRDKDGTKHEAVFSAGKYVFSDANKRQLVNALKSVNYGNLTDWSDASNIAIPIPRCAKINVTNISSMPNTKTTNARAIVQFWDMQGNTFTKTATLNAQGQHSMGDPKKNISIDLHDHNWDGDFSIKFGDWVPQSSFHLKSYWLDWSRVVCPVNYDVIEQVDKSRGILKDRTWKRALMTSSVTENSDLDLRMDTGAKCHPMGFPCIIYLNSEFYGIFIWQLKKHRDNYHMEKDNPNHIHVEGLNLSKGNSSWALNEIRNPKYLVYAEPHSGTYEYDGDIAVAEIAGEKDGIVASAYSASTTYTKGALCTLDGRMFMSLADNNIGNTPVACTKPKNVFKNATDYWIDVTFTNTVKRNILKAAGYRSEISAAATTEEKKALIERYYDMDNVIDIALEIAAMRDSDYVGNTQFTTWDGVKWYLNAYDKDRSLGLGFAKHTEPPSTGSLPTSGAFDYIIPYYKTEAKERWNELVEKGIFTLENISGILNNWMQRIGYDNYNLEDAKWPPSGDYIYDTVERLYNYIKQNLIVQNEYMNKL